MAQEWTSVVAFRDGRASTFLAVVAAWLAGCSDGGMSTRSGMLQAVGRPCDTTADAGPAQGVANTAAAMCPSQNLPQAGRPARRERGGRYHGALHRGVLAGQRLRRGIA